MWLLFFFQAEDGIRDGHVTGVQTCALPISNCSGEPMPSLANAKIVFFWVSVATTVALSPLKWAAAKSPRSCEVTDRSVMQCRGLSRSTLTRRTSALPYWFSPSTIEPASVSPVVLVVVLVVMLVVVDVSVVSLMRGLSLGQLPR